MVKRKVIFGYTTSQPEPADPYLMEVFDFSEYELYFNQHGDLSEKQFFDLRDHRRMTSALLASIAFAPVAFWYGTLYRVPEHARVMWFLFVVLFFCSPLVGWAWTEWLKYGRDLYDDPVASVTDTIHLDIRGAGRNGIVYYMIVADLNFKLSKEQLLALKNRNLYTVYFTQNTHRLLSIKPV